jgi:hypothetical protein
MKLSAPIHRLKSRARQLSRETGIPLHATLDQIARSEGFSGWSLLSARAVRPAAAPPALLSRLTAGDLLLLAARPGQGKTRLGLELVAEAIRAGRQAAFFTLEYTETGARERFRATGLDPDRTGDRLIVETSEDISAALMINRLAGAAPGTVAVVDYLQLLDQRRDKPPLAQQVDALAGFTHETGVIVALLSQVDRAYDPALQPLPTIQNLRLPNPVDLNLFSKFCFLQGGEMDLRAA